MNLDTAISAHAQWKTKFRTAISAKETMDAALKLIDGTSTFASASNTVVMAVNSLKKAIA